MIIKVQSLQRIISAILKPKKETQTHHTTAH